jgi:hypothetical protein
VEGWVFSEKLSLGVNYIYHITLTKSSLIGKFKINDWLAQVSGGTSIKTSYRRLNVT